jgi:hypothetical protein
MIKVFFVISLCTISSYATAAVPQIIVPFLVGFIFIVLLFFWGIYKLIKTQRNIFILALLPFIALVGAMFIY